MNFLSGENIIFNNSIINGFNNESELIILTCNSIFGSSELKFRSDDKTLNTFVNGEASSNIFGEATITVRNISDYEIELIIEGSLIDANIICYSEESGEFSSVLITSGMRIIKST